MIWRKIQNLLKRARVLSRRHSSNKPETGEIETFSKRFSVKTRWVMYYFFLKISGFGRSTSGFRGSRERGRGQAAEDRRGTSAEVTTIEPEFDSVEETIGSRAPRQRFRDRSR